MSTQSPEPQQPQQSQSSKGLQYFIGLGLGLIPLLLAGTLFFFQPSNPGYNIGIAGAILYVVLIIASIVCLIIERTRFIGYGLLTMVFVDPVVFFIACIVQFSRVGA